MSVSIDENEIGPRAAWRYLRLAVRALVAPAQPQLEQMRAHVPAIGLAMRLYLLFNFVLYGMVGLAFLVPSQAFHIGRTGLAVMDARLPHTLWGLTAAAVSVSQIAALLSDRWRVWQVCAVATAVWASALGVVTLVLAHSAGTYTGAILWFWVTGVHFLLISHQLVPHDDERRRLPLESLPEEDRSIIEAMEHLQQRTNARGGRGKKTGTTSRQLPFMATQQPSALMLPAGLSAALPLASFLLLCVLLPLH